MGTGADGSDRGIRYETGVHLRMEPVNMEDHLRRPYGCGPYGKTLLNKDGSA